jgi:hypothetical protein
MSSGSHLVVTSVVRNAGRLDSSGFVRVMDLTTGRTIMKSPLPEPRFRQSDPNPRGGLRGLRGVTCIGDRIVIANAERLFLFDAAWKPCGQISHPWFGGIHDILAEEDGIWVTCTSADLLVKVDWNGEIVGEWEWRRDKELARALGLGGIPHVRRDLDYRDPNSMRRGVPNAVHLNGIARGPGGLLLSFGRILSPKHYRKQRWTGVLGAIAVAAGVKARPHRPKSALVTDHVGRMAGCSSGVVLLQENWKSEVLLRVEGTSVPNHNVAQIGETIAYNDSNGGRIVAVALDGVSPDRSVTIPGNPSFARGLAQLDRTRFLVGSQAPAAIYLVDLAAGRVDTTFLLNGEATESVYGLCILPKRFLPPPDSLV